MVRVPPWVAEPEPDPVVVLLEPPQAVTPRTRAVADARRATERVLRIIRNAPCLVDPFRASPTGQAGTEAWVPRQLRLARGSRASRTPSPSRLRARTRISSRTPGMKR